MNTRVILAVLLVVSSVSPGVAGASNEPPQADAGLDRTVRVGETVYLDAGGSLDPDGRITNYEWTIRAPDGGETTRTGPRAAFEPSETGRYVVTLRVRDDDGATRRDTLYVDVRPAGDGTPSGTPSEGTPNSPTETPTGTPGGNTPGGEPNAEPTGRLSGPSTVERGTTGTFRAHVHDPDGRITAYDWSTAGEGQTVTRRFTEPPGTTVTVAVTVTDDDGGRRTFTKRVTVTDEGGSNDGPTANIDGPRYLTAGEQATFELTGTDTDGVITARQWETPTATSGGTLTRTFDEPGNYTLTAVVTDDDGAKAYATHTVRVVAGADEQPVASLSGPDVVPNGTDAVYEVDATDPDGGSVTVEWLSHSGGGRQELAPGGGGGTTPRFGKRLVIAGEAGDVVTVRARVTDDEGNSVVVSADTRVSTVEQPQEGDPKSPRINWIGSQHDPDTTPQDGEHDVIRSRYTLTVNVSHATGEDVLVQWEFCDGSHKTISLRRVDETETVSVKHTFLSESGGLNYCRVTTTAIDESGDSSTASQKIRVRTLKRGEQLRVRVRADEQTTGPGGRLTVPEDEIVAFDVASYQPFQIETGDGHGYVGKGTDNLQTRTITHRYDGPGQRVAVVTSIEGNDGIRAARVTIDVERIRYTEYRYVESVNRVESTVATERPSGVNWHRDRVIETERRETGEQRRVKQGAPISFPTKPNGSVTWVKAGTERETVTQTESKVAVNRPGPDWTLFTRRAERQTKTRSKIKTTWRDTRYSFGVWELVGSRTTKHPEYATGTSAPGAGWSRVGDTGRDSISGYAIEWRGYAGGAGYTGTRVCEQYAAVFGGRRCLAYRYKYRVPVYEDVYRWRSWEYDTDYKYQRVVKERVSVWAHTWKHTYTRTVTYDVYEKHLSMTEWLWKRNLTAAGDTVWSLKRPHTTEYVNGTLSVFQRRCDTDEGHFDQQAC